MGRAAGNDEQAEEREHPRIHKIAPDPNQVEERHRDQEIRERDHEVRNFMEPDHFWQPETVAMRHKVRAEQHTKKADHSMNALEWVPRLPGGSGRSRQRSRSTIPGRLRTK